MKMKKCFLVAILACLLNSNNSGTLLSKDYRLQRQSEVDKKFIKIQEKLRKEYPLPNNETELELISLFPTDDLIEKDIYLWGAHRMANDSLGNIYVSNGKEHCILKFDPSGHFLQKIGKKGQGPGEFMTPSKIMIGKIFLAVHDKTNRCVQFFDQKGKYLKSFKLFKSYIDMTMNEEGLIFATPILVTPQAPLIDVLSQDGDLLYSFGKQFSYSRNWDHLNEVALDLNMKGELLMAFRYFSIVRKYSIKGEMLAEYQIDHVNWNELAEENRKGGQRIGKSQGYLVTIMGIKGSHDGFYLLNIRPRIEILEFDGNGKLKMDYWNLDIRYRDRIDDFIVQNTGSENLFYMLQDRTDGKKVCVYKTKTKNKIIRR